MSFPDVKTVVTALLFGAILVVSPQTLRAQDDAERRRNLVQKPQAVAKLVDAGYPAWQVRRIAESLNQAGVAPAGFNAAVGSLPYLAGMLSSMEGAVNHYVLKAERGMKGEELVGSVRTELREQELPWETLLPVNESYLGESAGNLLARVKESIRDRRGFEEGEPQPAETEPGSRRRPAPAPSPGPGPGGPGQRGPGQPF